MTNFGHLFRSFHIILQFHKKLLECFSIFIFLLVGNTAGPHNVNIQIFHKCTLFKYLPTTHSVLTCFPLQVSTSYFCDTLCHAFVWPRSKQYTNTVHPTKKISSLFLASRKTGIREGIYEV
jgi:hypothetical protein